MPVVLLALLLVEVRTNLQTYRRIAQILAAPPVNAAAPSGWCGGEGLVRDPTPVIVGNAQAAIASVSRYRKGAGSDAPDTLESEDFHSEGSFLIDQDALRIEVDPREILWASYVVNAPEDTSFGYLAYDVETVIPTAGKVAWAGKLERGEDGALRLLHEGTRPALVVATSAKGMPRAILWRVAWHRRATIACLAAALVATAALGQVLGLV